MNIQDKPNPLKKIKNYISDFLYDAKLDFADLTNKLKPKQNDINYIDEKAKRKRRELICIWAVLIIPLINLAVFWVYGTIQSIPIAFEHYVLDKKVYDLFNFKYIFSQINLPGSLFSQSLFNTLKYFAFGFFFMTPLSYFMAYFLYKKIKGNKFFRFVFLFPTIISSVIIAGFYKALLGPNGQIQNLIATFTGLEEVLLLADSRYAFGSLLFYNFYTGLAGNLIYYLAAFSRIPKEIIESGRLDGLTTFKEVRYLIFPLTLPFFGTMLLLQITGILSSGGAALLLTGGSYGTYDLGFYEYMLTISGAGNDQGIAGAIGLMKGIVVLPLALIVNKIVKRIDSIEY